MKYWILKTEPSTYSFQDLIQDKKTCWSGIRNYLARNNLRMMKVGDMAIIYESSGPKAAVGLAKILKEAYQDPETKEDWSAVDIVPVRPFKKTISLAQMKADKLLSQMVIAKNSRLSVCPVTTKEFERLLALADA